LNNLPTSVDSIQIVYDSGQLWILNLTLAFVMFGIALEIRLADFKRLKTMPKAIVAGLLSQFIALPALTFLLVVWLQPHPGFALGMFMVAACPGGNVSNFMTHLAKGNTALSVSLTALSTLFAVVLTPLNFSFWGAIYEPTAGMLREIHIDLAEMSQVVGLLLGLPLVLGMSMRYVVPDLAERFARWFKFGSLLLFGLLIVVALYKDRLALQEYLGMIFGLVLVHNLLALSTGFFTAKLFKLPLAETKTLTLETGIQNSGLGLLLIFGFFGGLGGMAIVAAFWGIWHLISGLLIAGLWGRFNATREFLYKQVVYGFFKRFMQVALYFYYQKVSLIGLEHIPKNRPVMLLPNHQNGLLDPLILAAYIPRHRPFFLTRSDVFSNALLQRIFALFRMIPIYRMRDGRDTLGKNQAIFDRCVQLLSAGETVLLFPEANHNLKRQVRALSKGFTRIVFQTLDTYPDLDLQLVPVGINFQDAAGFPDRVSYHFGQPIAAKIFASVDDRKEAARSMIRAVFESLTNLTTHIPNTDLGANRYTDLATLKPDFLQPNSINRYLSGGVMEIPLVPNQSGLFYKSWDIFTKILLGPMWLPWRFLVRPRIGEVEFWSTFRFAYALLIFPIYLIAIGKVMGPLLGSPLTVFFVALIFINQLLYVKLRRPT
jgi:BASS family bile acid:Na+ symporter